MEIILRRTELIIDNVVDAYEEKANKKRKIKDNILELGAPLIIITCLTLICGIALMFFVPKIPSSLYYVIIFLYGFVMRLVESLIERKRHKIWEKNTQRYNKDLDLLSEILKTQEFNLYSKYKIKQLISKFKISIKERQNENKEKVDKAKVFLATYILPIIAFFAGKIEIKNTELIEWIATAVVIICIILLGKSIASSITELLKMISGDRLEQEKYVSLLLQDLLDRDFIVEKDDLIEVK